MPEDKPLRAVTPNLPLQPTAGYLASASLFSYATAALVGYPSAAVGSAPGFGPNNKLWFAIIFFLGTALTVYSAIPKSTSLLQINWLAILLACLAVFLTCLSINPAAVGNNAKMVLFFSIFSLGSPFWLPLVGLALHVGACAKVKG